MVMSFHACGGNVGDNAQIPLPKWVMQVRAGRRRLRLLAAPDVLVLCCSWRSAAQHVARAVPALSLAFNSNCEIWVVP